MSIYKEKQYKDFYLLDCLVITNIVFQTIVAKRDLFLTGVLTSSEARISNCLNDS